MVFSVVNRVMMSTFQGIFGSVVKSIESDPIGHPIGLYAGFISRELNG